MDEQIQTTVERLADLGEDARDVLVRAHVALGDERARDTLRELAHALLDPLPLIREREPGALLRQAPRDRPSDRPLVRDPEDEAALAFEASHGSRS